MAQKYGSTVKKFNIDFFAPIFFGVSHIFWETPTWVVDFKTNCDGHTDCQRDRRGNPTHFLKIDQKLENFFL